MSDPRGGTPTDSAAAPGALACFGERAHALAPRSLRGAALDPRVRVALRGDALTPAERSELVGVAGARIAPFASTGAATAAAPVTFEAPAAGALAAAARGADPAGALALVAATEAQARRPLPAPEIMGVVNVTPDSFSDGGRYLDPERAIEQGLALAAAGATWIDVGGESTRPGAAPVDPEEELERVLPVVQGLVAAGAPPVSIDTRRASVAAAALAAGARLVNDVSAGTHDPAMLATVAASDARFAAMHIQGTPATMQVRPTYGDPVAEIHEWLRERVSACLKAGIALPRIWLDPGIGFGKRLEDNLEILRRLPEFRSLGLPLLLGVSRKSFLAPLTGREQPSERLAGTAGAVAACVLGGASVLRLHDVGFLADVVAVSAALRPDAPPAAPS